MRDPVVQQVLQDMQTDKSGQAMQKAMRNKDMAAKIEKCVAGLARV